MADEYKISKDELSDRIIRNYAAQNYNALLKVSNGDVGTFIEKCAAWTDDNDKKCYSDLKNVWESIKEELDDTESLDKCVEQRNGHKSPEELAQAKLSTYATKIKVFQRGFTNEQLIDIFKGHYLPPEFRYKLEDAVETTIASYLAKRAEELSTKGARSDVRAYLEDCKQKELRPKEKETYDYLNELWGHFTKNLEPPASKGPIDLLNTFNRDLEIIVLNSEIPDKVYDTLRTEAKVKADFYANKASESKPRLSGNYIDVWKECEGNVRKFIEIYTKDTNPERYNRLTNTYNLFKDGLEGKGIEQGIGTAANESLGAGVSKYETEVAKDAARKDAMYTLLGLFTETVDSETNKGMHPSFGFVLREAAENEVREYLMNRREETLKSHEMSAK